MQNHKFPGWAGPIVGPIAGVVVGYRSLNRPANGLGEVRDQWPMLAGFGAAGLAAGLLIWGVDWYHGREGQRLEALKTRLAEPDSGSTFPPAINDRPTPPIAEL